MNKLLAEILDAHGSAERWREYAKVDATIASGGGFCALKGLVEDSSSVERRLGCMRNVHRSAPAARQISVRCLRLIESLSKSSMARWWRSDAPRDIPSQVTSCRHPGTRYISPISTARRSIPI